MNLNLENTDGNFIQQQVITWEIPNFASLPEDVGYCLDSRPFSTENATWCLRVYPKVAVSEAESYVGLVVVRISSLASHQTLRFEFEHEDPLEGEKIESSHEVPFGEGHEENGNLRFLDRTDLLDSLELSNTDDAVFKCAIHRESFVEVEQFTRPPKEIESLCQSMKHVAQCGHSHDVVFNVQGKEFGAHKDILRARSPVFEDILSQDEKGSSVVDIPDCDPETFRQFLLFLYCAEVESLDTGNVLALYHVARKYNVRHLKAKCLEFVKTSSCPGNIADIFQYAFDCNDDDLIDCAADYFTKDVYLILHSKEWKSVMERNLHRANQCILEVIKKLAENKMK